MMGNPMEIGVLHRHFSFALLKTGDIETRAPEGLMCQMLFMQDSRARVWRNW